MNATPTANTFYTAFNNNLQAVFKSKSKVIIDNDYNPLTQNNQEQGIDLAPYKTIGAAMTAKAGTPGSTLEFDIHPGTYPENLTITAITNRTFQGYAAGQQYRTTIKGNVVISGLSQRIAFKNIHIDGDLTVSATQGNYYFENVSVSGTVTLSGSGYV